MTGRESSTLPIGAKIAIAAAVLLVVGGVAVAVHYKQRKKTEQTEQDRRPTVQLVLPEASVPVVRYYGSPHHL